MDADELRSVFWPISREILNGRFHRTDNEYRVRALIVYQLMFSGRMIIRDSDYINFDILRKSIISSLVGRSDAADEFYRTLMDEKFIEIVYRKGTSISHLAQDLRNRGGDGAQIQNDEIDLSHVENYPVRWSFDLTRAETFYTENVQRVFSQSMASELPDNIREMLLIRMGEIVALKGKLTYFDLSPNGSIWDGIGERSKVAYSDFVYLKAAAAPHVGFIPTQLSVNPVYQSDIAQAMDLFRSRQATDFESTYRSSVRIDKSFSLSNYVRAISTLGIDDIYRIFESDERKTYLANAELGGRDDNSVRNLQESYVDLRRCVDDIIFSKNIVAADEDIELRFSAGISTAFGQVGKFAVEQAVEAVAGPLAGILTAGHNIIRKFETGETKEEAERRNAERRGAIKAMEFVSQVLADGEQIDRKLNPLDQGIDLQIDSNRNWRDSII